MKVKYHCDKCNTAYKEEAEAIACEGEHPTVKDLKLLNCHFRNMDGLYSYNRLEAQRIPERVNIEMSHIDVGGKYHRKLFAVYKLTDVVSQ